MKLPFQGVWVVGGNAMVAHMFQSREGYFIAKKPEMAKIVVWTGGADVDPKLYNEDKHPQTHISKHRDEEDLEAWHQNLGKDKLFVGICRGGQFLNVMNGGKMYQDVDNHTMSHMMIDTLSDEKLRVTSTHHQMMIPEKSAEVLGIAFESTRWSTAKSTVISEEPKKRGTQVPEVDYEVLWYPKTKSLCYQPHPEYGNANKACQDHFFSLIDSFK